jgi:CBS domain-containing protein
MLRFIDSLVLFACGVVLVAPLVYGIATLSGMRPKRLYPLLRVKRPDETCSALEISPHTCNEKEDTMVTARELMKQDLVTVGPDTSVADAAKVMKQREIGSVLVEEHGEIVGIVTEPDIVRKVVGADRIPHFLPIGEIMSRPVIGIDERRSITEAADLMERHQIRHLAVFKAGRIVGVLSVRDLLRPVSLDEF